VSEEAKPVDLTKSPTFQATFASLLVSLLISGGVGTVTINSTEACKCGARKKEAEAAATPAVSPAKLVVVEPTGGHGHNPPPAVDPVSSTPPSADLQRFIDGGATVGVRLANASDEETLQAARVFTTTHLDRFALLEFRKGYAILTRRGPFTEQSLAILRNNFAEVVPGKSVGR
jgi:hypothetical protein